MKVILASASPRRLELLTQIGLQVQVRPSFMGEGVAQYPYTEWVQKTARQKALTARITSEDVVVGADTIVVHQNSVLGKPGDKTEALQMLKTLSGSVHEVLTGICAVKGQGSARVIFQDVEMTKVYFRNLDSAEIRAYVASGEPMDKAGAYGIQGLGSLFVERIEGCYYNVVGLPLIKTMNLLRKCGVKILGEI